jgi:hypothetical protein
VWKNNIKMNLSYIGYVVIISSKTVTGCEMLTQLFSFIFHFCIRSDDPLYPYGSGVQGTESQGRGNHHSGHHNVTPVGDEAHKPQTRTRGRKRKFVWKVTGYTECTKTCGGGKLLCEGF